MPRGRNRSSAALAVVPVLVPGSGRPEPPADLDPLEQRIWREVIGARRRTMALNKEIADLTSELEIADERRQILEIKASGLHATETEPRLHPLDTRGLTPPSPERVHE